MAESPRYLEFRAELEAQTLAQVQSRLAEGYYDTGDKRQLWATQWVLEKETERQSRAADASERAASAAERSATATEISARWTAIAASCALVTTFIALIAYFSSR